MLTFAWRWFSGRELDGARRTNARWHTKGSDTLPGVREHEVLKWHYLPYGKRALVRAVGTGLAALLLVSFWYDPVQTWFVIKCLFGLGLGVFVFWACTGLANAEILQRWHEPLSVVLGARWRVDPAGLLLGITVPADCRTNAEHPVEIILPPNYRENDRAQEESAKLIARKVKIPVTAMDFSIDHEGPGPKMLVRAMEVPPEFVGFEDARDALERSGNGHYFLGFGLRRAEVWADLNGDGPHWVWSCGTGAGKTTAGRNVAAQVYREGGRVAIFDPAKEGDSHSDWIYDDDGNLLPDIEHFTDIASAHEGLIRLGKERSRRAFLTREAKRLRRPEPQFQRILIVLEEQNASADLLNDYWRSIRKDLAKAEECEQPSASPAMTALKSLVYAGRSAYMNCFVSCQRFDAKIVGGGDVRGNFMVRMLARFDEQARRMLIPDILPKPISSNRLGRAIVCMNGAATPVQGVLLESDEARDWARDGRPLVIEHVATSDVRHKEIIPAHVADQAEQASDIGHRTPLQLVRTPVEPEPQAPPKRLVSIKRAIEEGIVTGTYEAVSRASLRDGFPELRGHRGRDKLYCAEELADWEERRARRAAMSR